jgi:outer membrane protein OmpA-like peptidoglycan-associated protein
MRLHWIVIFMLASLGGCSWLSDSRKFSVYFEPYSADINQQGRETITAVAEFARAHPLQPVAVDGFSTPPDPRHDVDGLSAQRAEAVKQALITDGVAPIRITTAANGIVGPKSLPSVAVRRVDIGVGQ